MALEFRDYHTKHVALSILVDKELSNKESEFQQIAVYKSKDFGKILTIDGGIYFTEKDEFIYHEMLVHVPMAVHPHVRHALIIGGGDGGALRELLHYPEVERIDLVEQDEELIRAAQKHFPKISASLRDERAHVEVGDGLRYARTHENSYDLIIVDNNDPLGQGESFYTREFYGSCYKALREDGILVNQHESPYYKEDARMAREIYQKTQAVFPIDRIYQGHIPTYPSGHWLFGFLSKRYDPLADLDELRWNARGIHTRYYNTDLHRGAFALPNYVLKLLAPQE